MSVAAPEVVIQEGRGDSKQGMEYEKIFDHSFEFRDVDIDSGSPTSHKLEEPLFLQRLKFSIKPQASSYDELVGKLQKILKTTDDNERLSCVISLFDALYKNAVINNFIVNAYAEYQEKIKHQETVSSLEYFQYVHLSEYIEKQSIEGTEECSADKILTPPSSQERDSLIHVVYRDFIEKIPEKELFFEDLIDIFFRQSFFPSILESAQFLRYNAIEFTKEEATLAAFDEDQCVSFVFQKAQHVAMAIDKTRDALVAYFNSNNYKLILDNMDMVIDTPQKLRQDDAKHKINALSEIVAIFKSYVLEGVIQAFNKERGREEIKKKEEYKNIDSLEDQIREKPKLQNISLVDKEAIVERLATCPISYDRDFRARNRENYSFYVDSDQYEKSKREKEREVAFFDHKKYILILGIKVPKNSKLFYLFQNKDATADFFKHLTIITIPNMVGSVQSAVLRFLRLYPKALISAGPYVIYIEIGAFIYASVVSTYDILFLREQIKENNRLDESLCKNILYTLPEGIFYFNTLMSFMINVDLKIYPEHFNVSNGYFLSRVAAPTLLSTLLYMLWEITPLLKKERFFPRETKWDYLRKGINVFFQSGFYGGIFSYFGQTCSISRSYHYLLSILGIVPAILENFTSYKEIIKVIMNVLSAADFIAWTIRNPRILDVNGNPIEPDWHIILRASLIVGFAFCYSLVLSKAKFTIYVERYVRPEDRALVMIAREILIRNSEQNPPDKLALDRPARGVLVDTATYNRLIEHAKAGRDVENALFDLNIITTRGGNHRQPLLLSEPARAMARKSVMPVSALDPRASTAKLQATDTNGYPPVGNTVIPSGLPISATSPAVEQAGRKGCCSKCTIL